MSQIDIETIGLWVLAAFLAIATSVSVGALVRYQWARQRLAQKVTSAGAGLYKESDIKSLTFSDEDDAEKLSGRIEALFGYLSRSPHEGAKLRQKLIRAGIFYQHSVGMFLASRVVTALVLPILLVIIISIYAPGSSPAVKVFLPIAVSLIGLLLPDYYVSRRTANLQAECTRGFPDFLDLLVVATDAGLSLEAAMNRVGQTIILTYPSLGANVQLMTLEMRAGRDFSQAMEGLVDRIGIDEVRAFATLLQQSRELGSSVTQALRVYSEDMRHKRMSRAEEKAHSLPVRLVVPLGIFLFPVMILVALLPVALRIKAAFFTQ